MSDWLPGCIKQDFGTNGGSWTRQPAIICLHSTEGNSWPGYDGGQTAPHFTIDVRSGERRQHISMGLAARALQNLSGGVETNRAGVIQIEIIGTCETGHSGWLYVPSMNVDQIANLHRLCMDISEAKNIAWQSSVSFKQYPASYGSSNGVRLSNSSWNNYRGILGHQHVPENVHGDPGNINIAAILANEEDVMGDVTIVGMSSDVANVISKATWERYSPGGKNLATWIGEIGADVDYLRNSIEKLANHLGVQLDTPPDKSALMSDVQDYVPEE